MKPISPFHRLRPGDPAISAGNLNRALDELESAASLSGLRNFGGPTPGVQPPEYQPPRFPIRILSGSNPYAWEEVYYDSSQAAGSEWQTLADAQGQALNAGTANDLPAYEVESNESVPAGAIVEAWVDSDGERVLFRRPEGVQGTLVVAEVTITANQPAWDLEDADLYRVTASSGSLVVQGIAGGYDGARRVLWNVGNNAFSIAHNSGSAAETHYKVLCDGSADLSIPANGRAVLEYFAAEASDDGRWRACKNTSSAISSSTITVAEQDGSPSYTGISTVQADQAAGFVVTNPSAGVALISQTAASTVNNGYINATTQTLAGNKELYGSFTVDNNGGLPVYLICEQDYTPGSGVGTRSYLAYDGVYFEYDNGIGTTYDHKLYYSAGVFTVYAKAGSQIAYLSIYAATGKFLFYDGSGSTGYLELQRGASVYSGGDAVTGGMTFVGGLYISGSLSVGGTQISDIDIGTPIDGTATAILYIDGSGNLASSANLTYASDLLTIGNGGTLVTTAASAPSGIPSNSIAGPFLTD